MIHLLPVRNWCYACEIDVKGHASTVSTVNFRKARAPAVGGCLLKLAQAAMLMYCPTLQKLSAMLSGFGSYALGSRRGST